MISRRTRRLVAVAVAASLALAACGGDDDSDSSADSGDDDGTTEETAADDTTDDAADDTTEDTTDSAADGAADDTTADSDEPADDGESADGGTLTIAINGDPQSLDPGKNGAGPQQLVQWLSYEPLIRVMADGTYEPALAESWEYTSDDNSSFQLTLRPDVVFADGTPVTAQDVVDSVNYFVATPSPASSQLETLESIEAIDDVTVEATFSAPNPGARRLFSQLSNYGDVISPAGLADPEQLGTSTHGAGAYVLDPDETVSGDRYTFVPNENYWNPDLQHFDEVIVRIIGDPNTALNAVTTGQINVSTVTEPAQLDQVGDDVDLVTGGTLPIIVWIMDRNGEGQPALGDVRVREALNMAIDRETIATALGTAYSPLSQFGAPGSDAYVDGREPIPFDPEAAQALLEEAGYPDGFDLALASNTDNRDDEVSQILAQQWEDIGVTTDLQIYDNQPSEMFAAIADFQHGAITFALSLPLASYQSVITQPSVFNPWGASDPAVEDAYNAWAVSSPEEIDAAAAEVSTTINDLYWFVPVASVGNFFVSQGVDNLGSMSADGTYDVLNWTPGS